MYRWSNPFNWGHNIRWMYHDLINGITNLIHWFPYVWSDRDWDHSYLLGMMEHKLRRMSKTLANGITVGCDKNARMTLICANLCKRLNDDNYFRKAGEYFGWTSQSVKHARAVQKYDQYLLGHILGKYITHWWD